MPEPQLQIGVAGLGLLGRGIAACLVSRGFRVVGFTRPASGLESRRQHIQTALNELSQTTRGDLILLPQKTLAAGKLPAKPEFFGIVRKTNVIRNEQDAGKINLLAIYAAFRDAECRVSLCSLNTLADSTVLPARTAYEALTAITQKLKALPDSVYALQDVDDLARVSCVKSGSRPVIVWQGPQARALTEG